jgi:predicted CXXCH cytochrome family protein
VKVLITFRTPSRTGAGVSQQKKTVTAEWVRVGRNASCELHLPDPRIALEQGMIVNRGGLVYIEGEGGSQNITRKAVRAVRLNAGEPIEIGPYRIEAQAAPEGFDGALTVELVRAAQIGPDLATRTSKLTLASLGLSKRWIAWSLAFILLAVGFLLPAARVLDLPWKQTSQAMGVSDKLWNPGPVLLAHQPIEQQCSACHETAFQHVKDSSCLQCHGSVGHHVGPDLQPAALFDGARCATCHREHKGAKPTHRDDDGFCVDCHRDLGARMKSPGASNVSDFAKDHPPFRLAIPDGRGFTRVRQGTGTITDPSNLVYPHDVHLDPQGVRSPGKGRVVLECGSCHKPDASKRTFEPISMAKHCQECHRLEFEPAVTTREVPHGKPADAAAVIEEFYANLALKGVPDSFQKAFGVPGEGLLRRVGDPSPAERQNALRLASRKSQQVTKELFEVRVCKTCHQVSRPKDGQDWAIAPVRASNVWMPHARFDHKSHASSKCGDCHATASSKKSSDLSMPTIDNCRECHGGSKPVEKKVTSNCLLCHGFHESSHPWDPGFKPRATGRTVQGSVVPGGIPGGR